jgi:enoyl-[acyl-carrier protein] reductase II
MEFGTEFSRSLGLKYPIVQGGMSWASSNADLPLAVSTAGALGVIAAGPMYPDDLRTAIRAVTAHTSRPFAVNIPLTSKTAAAALDIVAEERVPIVIASQGGPRAHIQRFKDAGVPWLHVVASVEHARKAVDAGADALVVVGAEAGGHPPPSGVGTMVLLRAVVEAVSVPVIGAGGIGDGAGVAAALCLGASAVQLGTRFLLTQESNLHAAYKQVVLAAAIDDTTLLGVRFSPVRVLKNRFTAEFDVAERAGTPDDVLRTLFTSRSLKSAALDGDVEWGKVEAGQVAGIIDELLPAAEVVQRIVQEFHAACDRLTAIAAERTSP